MNALGLLIGITVLATNTAGAQQVWKVDCTGSPGSHFTDLPPAVAAAAVGDTILVYGTPGATCPGIYTAPVITKGLSIVGFFVGVAPGNNNPSHGIINGPLSISNIPAGQRVVISNVYLRHAIFYPPYGSGGVGSPITITDCDGSILLEDLIFYNLGTPGQLVKIERCDHVVLRGCRFWIANDPIRIIDSNVLLTSVLVQHMPPHAFSPYTTSSEAILLQRSSVTLVGSIVEGQGPLGMQLPRSAALLDNSTLRVGATSLLRGGLYAGSVSPYQPWDFAPAFQVTTPAPSVVEKDPRAPVFNHPWQQPPTITTIDETFHDWIVADEWFQVRVAGPAGGFALLVLGDMTMPTTSPWGTLGLDPLTANLFYLVPLPTTNGGVFTWNLFCPSSAPVGYPFTLQCLTLSPIGTLGLTEPSPLTVAWDKTRIP